MKLGPRSIPIRVLWKIYFSLRRVTFLGSWYDKFLMLLGFYLINLRIPKRGGDVNDYHFFLKWDGHLRLPERVFVTDKELSKIYVKGIVGDDFVIPTLAVLRSQGEVHTYDFPANCVIKATHSSGDYIIRRNSSNIDRSEISSWLEVDYYLKNREENYKNLVPKIIVEPIVFNREKVDEYKVFCKDGQAKVVLVIEDRHNSPRKSFFRPNWTHLEIESPNYISNPEFKKPRNLEDILHVSEKLSLNFSTIRVDLYSDGNKVYVGELTNCHNDVSSHYNGLGGKNLFDAWIGEF